LNISGNDVGIIPSVGGAPYISPNVPVGSGIVVQDHLVTVLLVCGYWWRYWDSANLSQAIVLILSMVLESVLIPMLM